VFYIEQLNPLRRDNMQLACREPQMQGYIHNANTDLYRRLIAESECDPKRDEDRHKTLLRLLDGKRGNSQRQEKPKAVFFPQTA
jgi:hypothetical protein